MKRANCLIRQNDGQILKRVFIVDGLDELRETIARERCELLQMISMHEVEIINTHLSGAELIRFFETVSTLISSGLNLQQTMDIVSVLQNDAKTEQIVRSIRGDISKGMLFYEALTRAIPGLPPLVSGMIRIGEKIGYLDSVLTHLLNYMRLMQAMREKMVSAAMYPALIVVMVVFGVIGLAVFFIPQLEKSLSGSSVMAATIKAGFVNLRIGMVVSSILVAIPVGIFVLYRVSKTRSPNIAASIEQMVYRLPLVGLVVTTSQLLTLSYSLEVLSKSSVQLDESLRLSAESGSSVAYRQALGAAAGDLKNGMALSMALDRQKLFPVYFIRWVQIAEQTGKVTQVFGQLRQYYEKELDKQISRVMVMVEPVLIALIGGALLSVIVTIVLPLFSMYSMGGQ